MPDIQCPPPSFLLDLLERIEVSSGTSLVAYSAPGERPLGELIFSGGQIGFIKMAVGQKVLGQRIEERYPETAAHLRRALGIARAEGRPLGDVLLRLGAVEAERIREALLDQIGDGLASLAAAAPGGLFETPLSGTARALTSTLSKFAPLEVYWRTIPALLPIEPDAAGMAYERFGDVAGRSILFSTTEGTHDVFPLATRGRSAASLAEVRRLGRDVLAIAAPPALDAAGLAARLLMLSGPHDALLVVRSSRQIAMFGELSSQARARILGGACEILSSAP